MKKCPVCSKVMKQENKYNIELDYCPDHGVWLDNGELESILNQKERVARTMLKRRVRRAKERATNRERHQGIWSLFSDSQ